MEKNETLVSHYNIDLSFLVTSQRILHTVIFLGLFEEKTSYTM
jgi:hypothetical protein